MKPYKLASREAHPENSVIEIGNVPFGGGEFIVIAGPCAVESGQQIIGTALAVKNAGARILRGSAFKPRTSPYDFQGLGIEALKLLKKAGEECMMPVETEVMTIGQLGDVEKYVDAVRIGARNMQNFDLLKAVGKIDKPVILKRGMSATIKEFLLAAEYIMNEGNGKVILCERGIRTFETETRNTLDLGAVAVIKELSHLPIIVDPSHATGKASLIAPMSRAALAAGADGLMVEVHIAPEKALCDNAQQLTPEQFAQLMLELRPVAKAMGKKI